MCGRADPGSCEVGTGGGLNCGGGVGGGMGAGGGSNGGGGGGAAAGCALGGGGRTWRCGGASGAAAAAVAAGFRDHLVDELGMFSRHRLAEFHLELLARRELFHQRLLLLLEPRAHLRDVEAVVHPGIVGGGGVHADAYVARRRRAGHDAASRSRSPAPRDARTFTFPERRAARGVAERRRPRADRGVRGGHRDQSDATARATRTPSRARRGSASALDPAATVPKPSVTSATETSRGCPERRAASRLPARLAE